MEIEYETDLIYHFIFSSGDYPYYSTWTDDYLNIIQLYKRKLNLDWMVTMLFIQLAGMPLVYLQKMLLEKWVLIQRNGQKSIVFKFSPSLKIFVTILVYSMSLLSNFLLWMKCLGISLHCFRNIDVMRHQLLSTGIIFDWNRVSFIGNIFLLRN